MEDGRRREKVREGTRQKERERGEEGLGRGRQVSDHFPGLPLLELCVSLFWKLQHYSVSQFACEVATPITGKHELLTPTSTIIATRTRLHRAASSRFN